MQRLFFVICGSSETTLSFLWNLTTKIVLLGCYLVSIPVGLSGLAEKEQKIVVLENWAASSKKQRHAWTVGRLGGALGEAEGIDVVSLEWEMDQSLTYVVHNSITLGPSSSLTLGRILQKSKINNIAWDTKLTNRGPQPDM